MRMGNVLWTIIAKCIFFSNNLLVMVDSYTRNHQMYSQNVERTELDSSTITSDYESKKMGAEHVFISCVDLYTALGFVSLIIGSI